jgi:ABC-type uncharacterized transport system auxiliary subunit
MSKMRLIFFFSIITLFGFQSCGERTLIRHYYVLEASEDSLTYLQDSVISNGICEILRVKIPPAYNQQRIAVRRRSHEISYYQYHYWAMNPADNLTGLLEKEIRRSHIFTFASSGNLNMVPDYQISSQVYKLEVEDINDQFQVSLEMRMELSEYSSGNSVLTHRFERKKTLEERDLNLFASELSQIYQEETSQFILKIASYFENINHQKSAEN